MCNKICYVKIAKTIAMYISTTVPLKTEQIINGKVLLIIKSKCDIRSVTCLLQMLLTNT